jgi:hypothetical protein
LQAKIDAIIAFSQNTFHTTQKDENTKRKKEEKNSKNLNELKP